MPTGSDGRFKLPCMAMILLGLHLLVSPTVLAVQDSAGGPSDRHDRASRSTPFCSIPEYRNRARDLFPELTYETVVEDQIFVTPQMRSLIKEYMGVTSIPYDILGKHIMYFPVTETNLPVGVMHFRKMAGKYGLVTVGWRIDLDFNLVDFVIDGRNPAIDEVMKMKEQLNTAFSAAGNSMLSKWVDPDKISLTQAGKEALQVEQSTDHVHDILGIVVYLAGLTRSSALIKYPDDEATHNASRARPVDLQKRLLILKSIPASLRKNVRDVKPVSSSRMDRVCKVIKSNNNPEIMEFKCRADGATRVLVNPGHSPFWLVDTQVTENKSVVLRWIVNDDLEILAVEPLYSDVIPYDDPWESLLEGVKKQVGSTAKVVGEQCSSGSEVLAKQVGILCRQLLLEDRGH